MNKKLITTTTATLMDEKHVPLTITVNDRAATREFIFKKMEDAGFDIQARSTWNAHKAKDSMDVDWDYSMIALHHAGRTYGCGNAGALAMKRAQNNHFGRGFDDIGYHFGIDCAGQVFEGRDIRSKGSGVELFNTGLLGIVLLEDLTVLGEVDDELNRWRDYMEVWKHQTQNSVPDIQIEAVLTLIGVLRQIFPIEILGGHREYPNQKGEGRYCPGNTGMGLVEALRKTTGLKRPSFS